MFCSNCGSESAPDSLFCHICGNGLKEKPLLSFDDFKSRKEEERRDRFIPKKQKTKRQKVGSGNDREPVGLVTIQVGMMSFRDDGLKMIRGSALPLKVLQTTTAEDLLHQAVTKHRKFNREVFGGPRSFALLYPDRSEVVNIPGSNNAFVLRQYKEELGKPYSRITFYICRKSDLLDSITSSLAVSDGSDADDRQVDKVEDKEDGHGSGVLVQGVGTTTTTTNTAEQPCVGAAGGAETSTATTSGATNPWNVTAAADDHIHVCNFMSLHYHNSTPFCTLRQ